MKLDIRLEGMRAKLGKVRKILAICSAKGGVGKSTLTFILASILSQRYKVGVWDLDLTGPSLHLMFDLRYSFEEEDGINPPQIYNNIFFLSVVFFSGDKPLSLRGSEVTEIFLELSSITNWGDVDYLLIDTPPTITDAFLDILRYIPQTEFVVVTTRSVLSYSTVLKMVQIINERKGRTRFLFENQIVPHSKEWKNSDLFDRLSSYFERLISIPFIKDIESYYGRVSAVLEIPEVQELKRTIDEIF